MQATATAASIRSESAVAAIRGHWPEYLIEGAALGLFMIAACASEVALAGIPDALARRILGGIAMGVTAVALVCSPWGQRSGAHMNPALTLAYWTLDKIAKWDAIFYMAAQFAGAVAGVALARIAIGPSVTYAVTRPGAAGAGAAFAAEFAISFLLVSVVLRFANSRRLSRYTPLAAGFMVASFIIVEAPLSGMSMNPARTFGSALPADVWTAIWIYFSAPPLAMIAAAQAYRRRCGAHRVFCAKFHHHNNQRCIFRCNYGALHNEQ